VIRQTADTMKFQLELPTGTFSTGDAFVRTLDHAYGSIHILDQLFDVPFVRSLNNVLANLAYVASEYDSDAGPRIRHLKCELPAQPLMAGDIDDEGLVSLLPKGKGAPHLSAVARVTAQALEQCYPDYSNIEIGRIHVNSIPHGDMQNTHEDGWPGTSLTALYFVNPDWQATWQGELILCDPLGESQYAIDPRPGRLVLFPGEIPHRGGAPSRVCYEHRLSLAHKFRATRKN
jgi:hypothetical protein